MPRISRLAGIACAFAAALVFSSQIASACSRDPLPQRAMTMVPTHNPDQALINRAILSEVNFQRCRAGLPRVSMHAGLARVAKTHATWMARTGSLSHRSGVSGQQTVQHRVLASGYQARLGSENIGALPRLPHQLASTDPGGCRRILNKARRKPPQTYAQVAITIVGMWMNSSAHRRNVLNRNIKSVGSAISYSPGRAPCGQFYLSQNFAG